MASTIPRAQAVLVVALAALTGCGGDETDAAAPPRDAGAPDADAGTGPRCPPGELDLGDGAACRKAGVDPAACADGFTADSGGCTPILPSSPCAPGTMAVPGETQCHEVAPCGQGTWGGIPVEADTEYVDGSYAGTDSDGSEQKPWTTVADGVVAAASGAIVAVAAGTYAEDVTIGKAVRLWGRCPSMVSIVGQKSTGAAVLILKSGANAAEVHALGVTGAGIGIIAIGAKDVIVDRVWAHDSGAVGIGAQGDFGPTSLTLRDSLIEVTKNNGFGVLGCEATLERVVVRDTVPGFASPGVGVEITTHPDTGKPATGTVRGSLVERNHAFGIQVGGSQATIEATAVNGNLSTPAKAFGGGIQVQDNPGTGARSTATIRASTFERNRYAGIIVGSSDATIEDTTVRDTDAQESNGLNGEGIAIESVSKALAPATGTIRTSLVEGNHEMGILVIGAEGTIESVIVRGTKPRIGDLLLGRGINIQVNPANSQRSTGTVRGSVVESNHEVGITVVGADGTIESCLVSGTQPQEADLAFGRGIDIGYEPITEERGVATVRQCLVEHSFDVGIMVQGSDGTVEDTTVRDTQPVQADQLFGDGIDVDLVEGKSASLVLARVHVEQSARAGIANFSALVQLGGSTLSCNAIDLDGETVTAPFEFHDDGGNSCGCETPGDCKVLTSSLAPPDPLHVE